MIKATGVYQIIVKGKKRWEVFTTPEEVKKELESQGDHPEICLTITEED